MPFGAVQLRPGVDVQHTLSDNEAGVSKAQLIRYKDGLLQTYGGWVDYVSFTISSTVRELHAWQGLTSNQYLAVGATQSLSVINSASVNNNITPQTNTTNPAPNFSISSGSNVVSIVDGGSSASIYSTVFFNTPVAVGNLLLTGAYAINSVQSSSVYTILSSVVASTTIASSGKLPIFDTSSGSALVTVILPNNGVQKVTGLFYPFFAGTTIGSQSIQGPYEIQSVIDSTSFQIGLSAQSTITSSFTMNSGNAQLVYYVTLGPAATGSGYGAGNYGAGAYGYGTSPSGSPGTPITTTDWTLDNWGEVLLACPVNGPIYTWSSDSGLLNAQVIANAPFQNGGIFVSQPQQILVAWRSCQPTGVQDPLLVVWSNALDYTNWTVSNQTTAGSFHFPTGSILRGGIQAPGFAMLFTDLDAWVMSYVGGEIIFNFTRVGTGCGLVGPHAVGILGGSVYWMSQNNFFVNGPNGVAPIPCTVWDTIFQNISQTYIPKTKLAINSAFNEVICFYPSAASAGENDSYVKVHIEGSEFEWDYGTLARTAWIDLSILGNPIATDPSSFIYQHEMGTIINGAAAPFFQSGWWTITNGSDLAFVDYVIPDFIWGLYAGPKDAQVYVTFFSANYPGDTPVSYGPYTVTQATEYINIRLRGRLMSVLVQSGSQEFWRIGRIRFRYALSGRR
jgi:hypothetical protein